MKRLQKFVSEHRAAAAIIAVVLVAFAAWTVHGALSPSGPAVTTSPAPAGAALRAAGHLSGVAAPALPGQQPSAGAAPGDGRAPAGQVTAPATSATGPAVSSPPAGTGRPDPFSPLAAPGGSAPVSTNPPLPPVPPLAPGALGPSGPTAAGAVIPGAPGLSGPRGQLQLTGIVYGAVAVAILNDGASSYIVEPGDTVTSGVRIVAIDAENRSVTLTSNNQSWQLRLGGGTSR